jgi:drug/metabolite transporter (DMT)-like permease
MVLALNFVILRAQPQVPILLVIGLGAVLAGATGVIVTGPAAMLQGEVWAIAICGLVILPVSFFSLSLASRYTHASNVSLLLLLETVLGPLWVWLGTGEGPTPMMLLGGLIVVVTLAIYLWQTGRRRMALQS